MARYITQRIIYMIITLFLIATATFFLMKLLPGTPFNMEDKLTEAQKAALYEQYGLNDPLPVQYANYIFGLVQGDMGISFQFDNRKVEDLIMDRIGPSAQLGFQSLVFGTVIGLILGLISAIKRNTAYDYSSNLMAILGKSIPSFVFAGLLQYYLAVKFGWFPVSFWDSFKHTILPTIANAMFTLAVTQRFLRTEMLEVLGSDYIVLARAKGLKNSVVTFKHGLRNALIPVITIMGPLVVSMMTGSLVIEKIFAIPGIGEQFVRSIQMNDYAMIMGTTMFFSILFVVVILIVDLLYVVVDPRIRLTGGKE
ncbi:oligopeptide transport system permease protein [Melghiribacillus thermohalophilus]|uniref:Oligopeptide transport system permease protein n=1 Tax=Melghiribacillus thermohalophilus TaxID=1324956 RepID=A0A4R3N6E8_9BACI|nr:oligopeptide ABC transporter permease [Melghiribacillus thermohalophilus]TCT22419.1 oligopeptide transport system permease protein [Melghiribacillus thermohalophilus]